MANKEISTVDLVKYDLNEKYMTQVTNFYDGDKRAAMRFMTGAIDYIRRLPKLQECSPISVINSLMLIASFRFTPSTVAGEAYIIPYAKEAPFQLGYKGYVTLFFRAGVKKIVADIVREHDKYSMKDSELSHEIDMTKSMAQRGKPIGAYVRATLPSGEEIVKFMNEADIINHGKKFSKAFNKPNSPWNAANDPELWMWKKTVLIQASKLLPKNDELVRAMAEDFKDSVINDRLEAATKESSSLRMGALLDTSTTNEKEQTQKGTTNSAEGEQEGRVRQATSSRAFLRALQLLMFVKFATNPLMFKVNYLNGETIDTTSTATNVLGKACHKAMQAYFGGGDVAVPADEGEAVKVGYEVGRAYLDAYSDGLIEWNAPIPNRAKLDERYSFAYFTYVREMGYTSKQENILVEKVLKHTVEVDGRTLPIPLKAIADRVYREGGKLKIQDHKFTTRHSSEDADRWRQALAGVLQLLHGICRDRREAIQYDVFRDEDHREPG